MVTHDERHAALLAAIERYDVDTDEDTAGGEDLAPFLDREEPIGRYCAGESGEFHYAYPSFETLAEAKAKAEENIGDGIYPESPVAVVDLDTGEAVEVTGARWADDELASDERGVLGQALDDAYTRIAENAEGTYTAEDVATARVTFTSLRAKLGLGAPTW